VQPGLFLIWLVAGDDDVVSEDFGFPAEALYGADPKPLLDRFNKRMFHITYSRIHEKNQWLMDELLPPVMRQSGRFVDHILQLSTVSLDDVERGLWHALKPADAIRLQRQ